MRKSSRIQCRNPPNGTKTSHLYLFLIEISFHTCCSKLHSHSVKYCHLDYLHVELLQIRYYEREHPSDLNTICINDQSLDTYWPLYCAFDDYRMNTSRMTSHWNYYLHRYLGPSLFASPRGALSNHKVKILASLLMLLQRQGSASLGARCSKMHKPKHLILDATHLRNMNILHVLHLNGEETCFEVKMPRSRNTRFSRSHPPSNLIIGTGQLGERFRRAINVILASGHIFFRARNVTHVYYSTSLENIKSWL